LLIIDYLPKDKQYLITRAIPCAKRVTDMEYNQEDAERILKEGDDEWISSHHGTPSTVKEIKDIDESLAVKISDIKIADDKILDINDIVDIDDPDLEGMFGHIGHIKCFDSASFDIFYCRLWYSGSGGCCGIKRGSNS
jgi:hypothetical protein